MNHFSAFPLALAFSFELGVIASDADTRDYRAMLIRERAPNIRASRALRVT